MVRTVGPCAQSRVPWAIATARDALLNDQPESATCFERPAKQALALATELQANSKREAIISVLYHNSRQVHTRNTYIHDLNDNLADDLYL